MQKRISGRKLAPALVVFILVTVCIFTLINIVFEDRVDDAYAGEWAATMIIQHQETSDGRWPENWDDLEAAYEQILEQERVIPFPMDDLKQRVEIDFDADPAELVTMPDPPGDAPPFEVIRHTSGDHRYWRGKNPNSEVLRYLLQRQEQGRAIGNVGQQPAGE